MGLFQNAVSKKGNSESAENAKRIEWIDIAKLFGMIAIYLGHFAEQAGRAYGFVFAFHVPFFFLISGCMNTYDHEKSFGKYVLKRAKRILLPFYGFGLLSIPPKLFTEGRQHLFQNLTGHLVQLLMGGIRNHFFALALWFLTCLFVIEIMFKAIKYLKQKVLIFLLPLICSVIAMFVLDPTPIADPHMFYNVDSALYYIIFFAIGYFAYPYLIRLFELDSTKKKIVFGVIYIVTVAYSVGVFFGFDLLSWPYITSIPVLLFMMIVRAVIISLAVMMTARFLTGIPQLAHMGRKTLFLCGNEWLIKFLVPGVFGLLGFRINLFHPVVALLYAILLIVVCVYIVIPVEERMLRFVVEKFFPEKKQTVS